MDREQTHAIVSKMTFCDINFLIIPNTSVSEQVKRKMDLSLQREIQHTKDQHSHPKCRISKGYDVYWR